jgi:aspartyl-tRNA synthetase
VLKTHTCGELSRKNAGETVTLAGWVDRRRDLGGLIFIDLRDRSGMVQVVFNPELHPESHAVADGMRNEFVIGVVGEVILRSEGTINPKMPTGHIEIVAREARIFNAALTPPFYINEDVDVDENLRLQYRYLDLRRARMQKNLMLRHRAVKYCRDFLDAKGFIEIETPILIKSTPEGARDYLVPSRLHPGEFYALPQSPQQIKQLLMVAGMEKYFQVARCFRDEDSRSDRQPEHTQLDIEMSFVEEEDIFALIEELFTGLVKQIRPECRVISPFPRLKFADVMARYGSDKPDLRFGLELTDISAIAAETDFGVFKNAVSKGGVVKGLCAPGCAGYTRSQLDDLNKFVKSLGAAGILTMSLDASVKDIDSLTMDNVKSVASKYMTLPQVQALVRRMKASPGDLILIAAGDTKTVHSVLSALRGEMARRLNLIPDDLFAFAFVTDFPLFEINETTKRIDSMHNPFSAPREEDIPLLKTDPLKVLGRQYDLVCNGYETASGSIRNHRPDIQKEIFRILEYTDNDINERFGPLIRAFDYGAPPHGGIAPGIDRVVMLLAGEDTIREVIAFPKNQAAADLTLEAPSPVAHEQLTELHLKVLEE